MLLNSTIAIYGGGPGSGCNPDVGHCGRPKGDEAVGFFSPNTSEGLKFPDAVKLLDSDEQKAAVTKAQALVDETFGTGVVHSAVGEWSDGAENSVVVTAPSSSKQDIDFVMASLGKEYNQKAVVSFAHDDEGKDAMYSLTTSKSMDEIRTALDKEGIEFRTLEPTEGGTIVHVFDPGITQTEATIRVAHSLGAEIDSVNGNGTLIGGDTREQGQEAYDKILSGYRKDARVRASGTRSNQKRNGSRNHRRTQA